MKFLRRKWPHPYGYFATEVFWRSFTANFCHPIPDDAMRAVFEELFGQIDVHEQPIFVDDLRWVPFAAGAVVYRPPDLGFDTIGLRFYLPSDRYSSSDLFFPFDGVAPSWR